MMNETVGKFCSLITSPTHITHSFTNQSIHTPFTGAATNARINATHLTDYFITGINYSLNWRKNSTYFWRQSKRRMKKGRRGGGISPNLPHSLYMERAGARTNCGLPLKNRKDRGQKQETRQKEDGHVEEKRKRQLHANGGINGLIKVNAGRQTTNCCVTQDAWTFTKTDY